MKTAAQELKELREKLANTQDFYSEEITLEEYRALEAAQEVLERLQRRAMLNTMVMVQGVLWS